MTQQDKELLFKDLCARLPYGVMVQYKGVETCTIDSICSDGKLLLKGESRYIPNEVMSSYKQMLRDRMPATISLALKWCKAKDRWIDYVYNRWIKKCPKHEKSNAVKYVLGLLPAYKLDDIKSEFRQIGKKQIKPIPYDELYLSFEDTIDLLGNDDAEYWKYVISWVIWFRRQMPFIENHYDLSKSKDSVEDIQKFIKTGYCSFLDDVWANKLAKYIVSYLEHV